MKTNHSYLQLGKFFPPDWGGVETVTSNLLNGLTELGVKNAAVVFGDSDSVESVEKGSTAAEVHRAKYIRIFGAPVSIGYISAFSRVSVGYDVVVIHLPNPIAALALAVSGYKGRVILYWHSDIVNKGLLGRMLVPLERWLVARADVVIAPTNAHLKHSLYASELMKKGRVVPYPIDPSLLAVAEKRRHSPRSLSGKKMIRLVAIGRLVEYKGLEFLFRSISHLRPEYCFVVDVLGDGPLKVYLDSLIVDLGLGSIVTLRGSVSEEERDNFLSNADIFCFPSITKQEMYGMVQYEAMAHGLPIISTDIVGSGTPEVTRTTGAGLVVAPCAPLEIAHAIHRLIDEPALYASLSAAGINAVCETFKPSVLIGEFCRQCET